MYYTNFAFFWVGKNIEIPQLLVNSINKSYSNEAKVYMLTDKKTPFIDGVTKTIRSLLPKSIMLGRLKSYAGINKIDDIVFLDADSLVIKKMPKIKSKEDLIIFQRDPVGKFYYRNLKNEEYPEFQNKNLEDVMPFLFGMIITHNSSAIKNFQEMYKVAQKLPERFHTWFADQYSLQTAFNKGIINAEVKKFSDFCQIISSPDCLIEKPVITFKGPHTKSLIKQYFDNCFY